MAPKKPGRSPKPPVTPSTKPTGLTNTQIAQGAAQADIQRRWETAYEMALHNLRGGVLQNNPILKPEQVSPDMPGQVPRERLFQEQVKVGGTPGTKKVAHIKNMTDRSAAAKKGWITRRAKKG